MTNADLISESSANPPPDWDSHPTDLLCPLCGYNLRHLTVARCPECGFAFQWRELLEAEKNKHKYLFEHGSGHNLKTFWQTFWTTCRPRKFWTDLNPAQRVRLGRLVVYWLIATCVVATIIGDPDITLLFSRAAASIDARSHMPALAGIPPGAAKQQLLLMQAMYPLPWELKFWTQTLPRRLYGGTYVTYSYGRLRRHDSPAVGWAIFLVIWPWLTLIALLIFRMSMRQAKIRTIHILRTVLYSCDFALLLAAALLATVIYDPRAADGWLLLGGAIVCALITTYRLSIAFGKYLRVHLPLATVLATQLIVVLLVFVVLAQFAKF